MSRCFTINKQRYQSRQGKTRQLLIKKMPCAFCDGEFENEFRKIKIGVRNQRIPLKQYCTGTRCQKAGINFRTSLVRHLQSDNLSSNLTAQYVLWKMITRTPIKYLTPVLYDNFESARPKNPCRVMWTIPKRQRSTKKVLPIKE